MDRIYINDEYSKRKGQGFSDPQNKQALDKDLMNDNGEFSIIALQQKIGI
jgi:hypothetical protein